MYGATFNPTRCGARGVSCGRVAGKRAQSSPMYLNGLFRSLRRFMQLSMHCACTLPPRDAAMRPDQEVCAHMGQAQSVTCE